MTKSKKENLEKLGLIGTNIKGLSAATDKLRKIYETEQFECVDENENIKGIVDYLLIKKEIDHDGDLSYHDRKTELSKFNVNENSDAFKIVEKVFDILIDEGRLTKWWNYDD